MQTVLDFVAKHEGFAIPEDTVSLIAADAGGNLRKAILVLEALKMQKCVPSPFLLSLLCYPTIRRLLTRVGSPDLSVSALSIAKPDWETYCHKVADMIVQEQSPARVMEVRAKLYELLSHCIPPTIILKVRTRP